MWTLDSIGLAACFEGARGSDFIEELPYLLSIAAASGQHRIVMASPCLGNTVYCSIEVQLAGEASPLPPSVEIDLWLDWSLLLDNSKLPCSQDTTLLC